MPPTAPARRHEAAALTSVSPGGRNALALRIVAGECLRLRSRYSDCDKCVRACPRQALRVGSEGVELADGCLRCGQCGAACPSGALKLPLTIDERAIAAKDAALYVDCWKVPATRSPRPALRVRCLGALALRDLMRWQAARPRGHMVLLDRGWCNACSAGRQRDHPALAVLREARSLLTALGEPREALPRLETAPLPAHAMPAEIPEPAAVRSSARRRFFARFAEREGPRPRRTGVARIGSNARKRLLEDVARLAARHGRSVPAELFPALRISQACFNHRVCAAICPTGALRAYESGSDASAGVAFDASACIVCGDCTRGCPEGAVTLLGQGEPPSGEFLTRFRMVECPACGHAYPARGADDACPNCRRTRELARSLFLVSNRGRIAGEG